MTTGTLTVHMRNDERNLFEAFLRCSRRYLEFGAGGSTCLAASLVESAIISVDSAPAWLDKVREQCATQLKVLRPTLVHAEIGETREWGWPKDEKRKNDWPRYHTDVWSHPESTDCDTFLVDGRFRVACAMQIVLRAAPRAFILIHDFHSRPVYHVVRDVLDEIARAGDLAVFQRKTGYDPAYALAILEEHRFRPD